LAFSSDHRTENKLTSVTFQGTILADDLGGKYTSPFIGDLKEVYIAKDGGPGTYKKFAGGGTWKKTESITPPPKPAAATSAVSVKETPGLEYTIYGKEYAVSAGTVNQGAVVIPATYNNLPVTRIKMDGFNGSSITDITIPNSVIRIHDCAFDDCTSLTSVTFQGTITANNFSSFYAFPGDLRAKYLKGGPGTYTRPDGKSKTWTKQ